MRVMPFSPTLCRASRQSFTFSSTFAQSHDDTRHQPISKPFGRGPLLSISIFGWTRVRSWSAHVSKLQSRPFAPTMSSGALVEEANGHSEHGKRKQQSFLMKSIEEWTTITFLISQGSGILATCLFQLNWQFRGSEIIATIVWIFTILIFAIFSFIYIAKTCLFTKTVRRQLTSDIMELCCLSSPVITFGVIINMVALVCAKAWGPSWGMVAYVLNWINIFLSFVVAVGIPYVYFRCCPPGVDSTPPSVILPAIASLTASSACAIVCFNSKLQARTQVPMIITGYVLLGLGLADAVALIFVYISRLLNGGFPNKAQLWMTYIIFGPLGQASVAMQYLGKAASSPGNMTFASYNRGTFITKNAGDVLGTVGTLSGLLVWSYGVWWLLFSIAMTVHLGIFADGGIRQYSLSAWSVVFPLVGYCMPSICVFDADKEPGCARIGSY